MEWQSFAISGKVKMSDNIKSSKKVALPVGKLVEGTRSEGAKMGELWRINFSRVEWTVMQVPDVKKSHIRAGWGRILERSSSPRRRQLGVESSGGNSDAPS